MPGSTQRNLGSPTIQKVRVTRVGVAEARHNYGDHRLIVARGHQPGSYRFHKLRDSPKTNCEPQHSHTSAAFHSLDDTRGSHARSTSAKRRLAAHPPDLDITDDIHAAIIPSHSSTH